MDGLGQFERRVLLAVSHLRGNGYAVSIAGDINERFGKSPSLGAIYATLDRLETKRFVTSRLGDPTPQRGGKPKRFYQIEALGQQALMSAMEGERRAWSLPLPGEAPA